MKYLTNREVAQALLDGKNVLFDGKSAKGKGVDFTRLDDLTLYTLAPETITRTITYPKPYTGPMKVGQEYFIPSVISFDFYESIRWTDTGTDKKWQSRSLIHLNKDDAIAHAKAMIGGEG